MNNTTVDLSTQGFELDLDLPSADNPLAQIPPTGAMRVVAIGGGTGLSTLLRGLKRNVVAANQPRIMHDARRLISDLAAVVTVTDDGGSSGRLRKDFNMLPPGDLRNCMVALSEREDLMTQLFSHRFRSGDALEGHNIGNLFVAALTEISGDFGKAIQLASKILAVRGRIYPVTTANAKILARMEDGSIVCGETNITASHKRIAELMLDPADAAPMPETLEAIERADMITVGPGSLYTSLITNLLVKGIPAAIASSRGVRVFVCNLMSQANESLGLTASQHIECIYEHTREPIFDYALINTAPFSEEIMARYAAEGAAPIVADFDRIEALGVQCIAGNFAGEGSLVRHASFSVTDALLTLGQAAFNKRMQESS